MKLAIKKTVIGRAYYALPQPIFTRYGIFKAPNVGQCGHSAWYIRCLNWIHMTDIYERLVVHCPTHEASDYLAAFIADHKQDDGSVRMTLRLPISRHSDRRPMTERAVVGTLRSVKGISDPYPTYSLTWLPKGDGPSPEFDGALAVENVAQDDSFGLVLSGHCAPLGAVAAKSGAARRVARVSPRAVLHAIASYVEDAHAHNEAALAGHSPLSYRSIQSSQHRVDSGLDRHVSSGLEQRKVGRCDFKELSGRWNDRFDGLLPGQSAPNVSLASGSEPKPEAPKESACAADGDGDPC